MKTEEQVKNFNEQEYYLELLLEQIQCQKAKEAVEEEIRCHIEDQKTAYMEKGMEEQEAEKEAVRQMGDPVEAGIRLDKVHRPKMAWDMIILIAFLSGVGLLIQYLLRMHLDYTSFMPVPVKGVLCCFGGILVMLAICFLDYTLIARCAKQIYCLAIGMEILYLFVHGGIGYVNYGFLHCRIVMYIPLYAAILYSYRGQGYGGLVKGILWTLPIGGLLILSPRSSMLAIMGIAIVSTLSVAVYKEWFKVSRRLVLSVLWAVVLLAPIILIRVIMRGNTVLQARLQVLLHPFSLDPDRWYGRFVPQFFAENQWIGMNRLLEAGEWKYSLSPSNDYTLAYVSCYYGSLAAVILIGLMLLLLIRGLLISLRQKNQLGMLMGTSTVIVLLVQFVLYVLCNAGILPSAIYCPFITYGGSGIMSTSVLFGILLSIYRYQNVLVREPKIKKLLTSWGIMVNGKYIFKN